METYNERLFMNIALLLLAQNMETLHSSYSQLYALCNPNTPCLRLLADNHYPREYPVNGGWCGTWYGMSRGRLT